MNATLPPSGRAGVGRIPGRYFPAVELGGLGPDALSIRVPEVVLDAFRDVTVFSNGVAGFLGSGDAWDITHYLFPKMNPVVDGDVFASRVAADMAEGLSIDEGPLAHDRLVTGAGMVFGFSSGHIPSEIKTLLGLLAMGILGYGVYRLRQLAKLHQFFITHGRRLEGAEGRYIGSRGGDRWGPRKVVEEVFKRRGEEVAELYVDAFERLASDDRRDLIFDLVDLYRLDGMYEMGFQFSTVIVRLIAVDRFNAAQFFLQRSRNADLLQVVIEASEASGGESPSAGLWDLITSPSFDRMAEAVFRYVGTYEGSDGRVRLSLDAERYAKGIEDFLLGIVDNTRVILPLRRYAKYLHDNWYRMELLPDHHLLEIVHFFAEIGSSRQMGRLSDLLVDITGVSFERVGDKDDYIAMWLVGREADLVTQGLTSGESGREISRSGADLTLLKGYRTYDVDGRSYDIWMRGPSPHSGEMIDLLDSRTPQNERSFSRMNLHLVIRNEDGREVLIKVRIRGDRLYINQAYLTIKRIELTEEELAALGQFALDMNLEGILM